MMNNIEANKGKERKSALCAFMAQFVENQLRLYAHQIHVLQTSVSFFKYQHSPEKISTREHLLQCTYILSPLSYRKGSLCPPPRKRLAEVVAFHGGRRSLVPLLVMSHTIHYRCHC